MTDRPARVNDVNTVMLLSRSREMTLGTRIVFTCPYAIHFIPTNMVRNRAREPAHAQTKHQDNSTSGRGARASYQTISPEISARGSLL